MCPLNSSPDRKVQNPDAQSGIHGECVNMASHRHQGSNYRTTDLFAIRGKYGKVPETGTLDHRRLYCMQQAGCQQVNDDCTVRLCEMPNKCEQSIVPTSICILNCISAVLWN